MERLEERNRCERLSQRIKEKVAPYGFTAHFIACSPGQGGGMSLVTP